MAAAHIKAAIYARVSTFDQEPENQLQELRRYAAARGWQTTEFVDRGVSGAKDSRPALDTLVRDAKRQRFDTPRWTLEIRPLVDGSKPATTGVATETVLSTSRPPHGASAGFQFRSGLVSRLT